MGRMYRKPKSVTAAIANGAATSSAVEQQVEAFGGFLMPAAFTGATVSFTVSQDGVTYVALYSAANALVSITVAASRAYPLPSELAGFRYFKFVSASNEGAERAIEVALKS